MRALIATIVVGPRTWDSLVVPHHALCLTGNSVPLLDPASRARLGPSAANPRVHGGVRWLTSVEADAQERGALVDSGAD